MSAREQTAFRRSIIPDNANRDKDDFYPTPPQGTRALLSVETFSGPIWEPACGDGAMSKVLEAAGHFVISTDLVARGYAPGGTDFLMEHIGRAPNIVTNPPFKLAKEFAEHALRLSTGKVAILARLQFLEGSSRREFFQNTPLARVWTFSKRLTITRAGEPWRSSQGGLIAYAWFVWDHSYKGKPELGWI